jgi:hypothetical protein
MVKLKVRKYAPSFWHASGPVRRKQYAYCKDCVHHGKNGNDYSEKCDLPGVDRFTPHNGFCYMARPITAKEAKKHGE